MASPITRSDSECFNFVPVTKEISSTADLLSIFTDAVCISVHLQRAKGSQVSALSSSPLPICGYAPHFFIS